MKRRHFISLFFFFWVTNIFSQKIIPLYADKAPGSENWAQQEREMTFPGFNIVLVQNVTKPTLRVYEPTSRLPSGTAIIVAPGGGLETIVEGVEGTPVAK